MLAKFVGHEVAPVLKDTLSISADVASFTPVPGLEELAKALLSVWDACQKVDVSALLVWTRIYFPFNALLQKDKPSLLSASGRALCDAPLFCSMRDGRSKPENCYGPH